MWDTSTFIIIQSKDIYNNNLVPLALLLFVYHESRLTFSYLDKAWARKMLG